MQTTLSVYSNSNERIDWKYQLESVDNPPDYSYLSAREAGLKIHNWIFDNFSSMNLEFNGWIKIWRNGQAKPIRYDAFDGKTVYDFKTTTENIFQTVPRRTDISQIRSYMKYLEAERGVIVYINRENFRVREIEVN